MARAASYLHTRFFECPDGYRALLAGFQGPRHAQARRLTVLELEEDLHLLLVVPPAAPGSTVVAAPTAQDVVLGRTADLKTGAGATDAADIYVVPNAKYYSATGKEVKLDTATASTAGTARVVIEGYYFGR